MPENSSYIFGDGNIDLQNIENSNITVNFGNYDKPEVKTKKQTVNNLLTEIIQKLAEFERIQVAKETKPENIDADLFDEVQWDDLLDSIQYNKCVVFIGPEISVDENGSSLHENFNRSSGKQGLEYNEKDCFFMPGLDKSDTEKDILMKVMKYYSNQFTAHNTLGNQIIENIAKIPFPLIVSVAPDETIHKVFHVHNKPHNFYAYNGKTLDIQIPTVENPVLYNLLGSPLGSPVDKPASEKANEKGFYIFMHEHYYDYMQKSTNVRLPLNICDMIKNAHRFLFIGIDFNKWYNRLLMFCLDVKAKGFSCYPTDLDSVHSNFIKQQFKITHAQGNYLKFVEILLSKCIERGLYKPLYRYFVEQTLQKVNDQRILAMKTDNEGELQEIIGHIEMLLSETIYKLNNVN